MKLMSAPKVRGQVTYFLALHELAHCVLHRRGRRPRLVEDAEAWQWALDHALMDPSPATARRMYAKLMTYLRSYHQKNIRHNRMLRTIPERNAEFWRVCNVLADLGETPTLARYHLTVRPCDYPATGNFAILQV